MSILGTFLVVVPLFQHTGHVTAALKRALNFNDISVLDGVESCRARGPGCAVGKNHTSVPYCVRGHR